jgi:hypothetical protein
MTDWTVLHIAAGVLAGNLLTLSMFWAFRELNTDEKFEKNRSWWPLLAAGLPLLFLISVLHQTLT